MGIFGTKIHKQAGQGDFSFLSSDEMYFDSACQTLRPIQVIEAQKKYFEEFNTCGGRVKYAWGEELDSIIEASRKETLDLLGLNDDYLVAFTLNTTYGINLILQQIRLGAFDRIITSEIEHNSVFLPTMTAAKRLGVDRRVLERGEDGELLYSGADLKSALVVLNATSNLDGRSLSNIRELISDAHAGGGAIVLDGAQTMAHDRGLLRGVEFDALAFSAHKMYGPSLGVLVVRKDFLSKLEPYWLGGGTVKAVAKDSFELIGSDVDAAARFEAGLQNFSGIVGYKAALDWLKSNRDIEADGRRLGAKLFGALSGMPIEILNKKAAPIISFSSPRIDSHRLALYLSQNGMMARSGYFCCHYYLGEKLKSRPLLRISIGANNSDSQVDHLIDSLATILKNS